MGLDMNLYAKKYISNYQEESKCLNAKLREMFNLEKGEDLDSCEVKFSCAYWRKSNQIHNWFVENTQKGEDNCQESDVSREQIIELKELCEKVVKILSEQKRKKVMLKDRFSKEEYEHDIYEDTEEIEELMPTKQGFFFGGYEYDEYYLNDMEHTIEVLNKCLEDFPEKDSWEFSYRASW